MCDLEFLFLSGRDARLRGKHDGESGSGKLVRQWRDYIFGNRAGGREDPEDSACAGGQTNCAQAFSGEGGARQPCSTGTGQLGPCKRFAKRQGSRRESQKPSRLASGVTHTQLEPPGCDDHHFPPETLQRSLPPNQRRPREWWALPEASALHGLHHHFHLTK